MKKRLLQISFLLMLLLMVLGCDAKNSADAPIIFASDSWASNRFYNEIAKFIIEKTCGNMSRRN